MGLKVKATEIFSGGVIPMATVYFYALLFILLFFISQLLPRYVNH